MTTPGRELLVAGVDGCRSGWLVAVAAHEPQPALREILVVRTFADLLAATVGCSAVAVDIPIGLPQSGPREADIAARRVLGAPRARSVFPAPARGVLSAPDYATACAVSEAVSGKRLSRQTFAILAKIREADLAIQPGDQSRLCEGHPEVSFASLNYGGAMGHNKKTAAGRTERARLLSDLYGVNVAAIDVPPGAARDDLYDAIVLTWTAVRIARAEAVHLPATPQLDSRGLRMEIVY